MMQVTLNIDAAKLEKPVEEILASLTTDDKRELAKTMMAEYFRIGESAIDPEKDREAISKARKNQYYLERRTDDEVRQSHEYRVAIGPHATIKQQLFHAAIKAMADECHAEVKRIIKEDAAFQAVVEVVNETVKAAMPRAIQDALILWVASNLDKAVSGITNGITLSDNGSGGMRASLMPDVSKIVAEKMKERGIEY